MRKMLVALPVLLAFSGCTSARIDTVAASGPAATGPRGGVASYIGESDRASADALMRSYCAPNDVSVLGRGRLAAHRILLPGPVMAASMSAMRTYVRFQCGT